MNRYHFDIVTVFHSEENRVQARGLRTRIHKVEPGGGYRFFAVDNRQNNRGFAKGCNVGAFHPEADAPIIAFLNPDVRVSGPFFDAVSGTLGGKVVITGMRFGKPDHELRIWGVRDWVCGAVFFVDRKWFTSVGGFDEQFTWSHEETDLIRQAERQGLHCRSIPLPIDHASPAADTPDDAAYKRYHFKKAQKRYREKWRG